MLFALRSSHDTSLITRFSVLLTPLFAFLPKCPFRILSAKPRPQVYPQVASYFKSRTRIVERRTSNKVAMSKARYKCSVVCDHTAEVRRVFPIHSEDPFVWVVWRWAVEMSREPAPSWRGIYFSKKRRSRMQICGLFCYGDALNGVLVFGQSK